MEKQPKVSIFSLPLEQFEKLSQEELSQAAKDAGVSVEKLRELVGRAGANKKKEAETRSKNSEAPIPVEQDENALRIRQAIKDGLSQIYFNNISRDLAKAEKLIQRADEAIKEIELHENLGDYSSAKLAGQRKAASTLYKRAYEIRTMYEIDELIKSGKNYFDACEEVVKKYEERANGTNLREEGDGIYDALWGLKFYTRNDSIKKLRPLYESLTAGKPLSDEQEELLRMLTKEAKRALFKGDRGGDSVIDILARSLRAVWKKELSGTSGAAERYDIGFPAGSAYYKGSRPRRDIYGQSGGENDK